MRRRNSASMGSLILGRGGGGGNAGNVGAGGDDDSRSDIWSTEVLASDSDHPDTQSDYLQDLDSETNNSVINLLFLLFLSCLLVVCCCCCLLLLFTFVGVCNCC